MSARNASAAQQLPVDADTHFLDRTSERIRAYVASLVPQDGDTDENYFRGRSLIEQLAISSHGSDEPTLKLTASQCADIMAFMVYSVPLEQRTWWSDPKHAPSHLCGFTFVLRAVESSMRRRS